VPVHDWTIRIGHGVYGLVQYRDADCNFWFGDRYIVTLPFSAPVTAAFLFILIILLLFAAWHFIGNLRHRDAPGDA